MLKDKIKQNLKTALKGKDKVACLTLRGVLAAILNKEKTYQASQEVNLTDEEINEIVFSETKKRKEAIVEYEKGNRQDLAEKEKAELKVLEEYLPEQLSEEEIRSLVKETIEEVGADDIGKVMKTLMPKVKGKADGGLVAKIVKDSLKV